MEGEGPSEHGLLRRWSSCRDTVLRSTGYGTLYGALLLALFRRWDLRLCSLAAGTGVGLGLGVSACRASFVQPPLYDPRRVRVVPHGTPIQQDATTH